MLRMYFALRIIGIGLECLNRSPIGTKKKIYIQGRFRRESGLIVDMPK